MNLLIVSATPFEIAPLSAWLESNTTTHTIDLLVTGVGMTVTTYALTRHLQHKKNYDLVLQAGVGGSFDPAISLGDVVFITSDLNADLGAEDHDQYLDIFEMGLLEKDTPPYINGRLQTPLLPIHEQIALPQVSGLTVNTVSGSTRTIAMRSQKYGCAIESMEGAAFHYVCLNEQVPFAQVRAISNYVTPRDKSQWKMKDAIVNLNKWLMAFIEGLN